MSLNHSALNKCTIKSLVLITHVIFFFWYWYLISYLYQLWNESTFCNHKYTPDSASRDCLRTFSALSYCRSFNNNSARSCLQDKIHKLRFTSFQVICLNLKINNLSYTNLVSFSGSRRFYRHICTFKLVFFFQSLSNVNTNNNKNECQKTQQGLKFYLRWKRLLKKWIKIQRSWKSWMNNAWIMPIINVK